MLSYAQLAAGDTSYYTDNTGRSKKVKNSYLGTESPPLSQNYFATQKVPIEQIVKFAKTNPNRDYYDPAVLSDLFSYNSNSNQQKQNYYQTSTEMPQNYYKTSQSQSAPQTIKNSNKATTNNVFGQKIRSQQPQQKHHHQQHQQQQQQPQAQPWVSVEKQVIKELNDNQYRQPQNINLQQMPHRGFHGQPNYRVNNRHMNFRKNQRPQKIVSQYNDEAEYLKQYHYDSEVPSLLNDTLVNFLNNQRPINPYSEFIDITNIHPIAPPVQHSPPNYNNNFNNRYPVLFPGQYQRLPLQQAPQQPHSHHLQQQQQQYAPLEKDIVVNYKYPLPQINPESVSITSPSMVFNRPHNTFKRKADVEQQSQSQQQQPQAQPSKRKSSRVYYISPPNEQQQKQK
jgi:hypothetical protein